MELGSIGQLTLRGRQASSNRIAGPGRLIGIFPISTMNGPRRFGFLFPGRPIDSSMVSAMFTPPLIKGASIILGRPGNVDPSERGGDFME